jgi:lactate permease
MSIISQIMVNSINNYLGMASMIDFLAINVKNVFLPFLASFVGAFGSFLTGSATISNLMFGNFLVATSKDLGFGTDKILALALVGGAAGNMIALADIIAAQTVVGLKNEERRVLAGVIGPCLVYLALIGFVGLLVV